MTSRSRAAGWEKEVGWPEICLRPGGLADRPAIGKADLGRAKLVGTVAREGVALVTVELLERATADNGVWLDLQEGHVPIGQAVEACVTHGVSVRG